MLRVDKVGRVHRVESLVRGAVSGYGVRVKFECSIRVSWRIQLMHKHKARRWMCKKDEVQTSPQKSKKKRWRFLLFFPCTPGVV